MKDNILKALEAKQTVNKVENDVQKAADVIMKDDNAKNTTEDLSMQLDQVALALLAMQDVLSSAIVRIKALEMKVFGEEQQEQPQETEQPEQPKE